MLRNLVWNNYMPGYDYLNNKFSFKTVFHNTSYSYCCCRCPFIHKYLDYITEDGGIDGDLFKQVSKYFTMTANVVIANLIRLFHGRDPVPYSPEINHIVPGLISCVNCFKNNYYTHVILKCGALFPCFFS